MSLQINDPAYPHLPDEKSFTVRDPEGGGVSVQPWLEGDHRNASEVSVVVGNIDGFEDDEDDHSDEFSISIVDRAEFVEGILAVFPELKRA
jgi:hypothetical protein